MRTGCQRQLSAYTVKRGLSVGNEQDNRATKNDTMRVFAEQEWHFTYPYSSARLALLAAVPVRAAAHSSERIPGAAHTVENLR